MLKNFYLKIKNYKDWHVVILSIWCLITFFLMFNHNPWYDEAHAWMLAKFMNFDNWVDIIKIEGHPVLWFLILKPFTYFQKLYPYPMLIINYIFCFLSLFIMWKKTLFPIWFKIAITFSPLYILYFPIVARNYSIGLLGIFLLATLYPKRLQNPIQYATIIGFTINTHVILGIGASWFGIALLISLIKDGIKKEKHLIAILIVILSALFFIFPYIGGFGCESVSHFGRPTLGSLKNFIRVLGPLYYIPFTLVLGYIFTKNNFAAKSFILYTYFLLLILFKFFYGGYPHHYIYFLIYLLIPFWIDPSPKQSNNFKTNLLYFVVAALFFFPFLKFFKHCYLWDFFNLHPVVNYLKNNNELENKFLYVDASLYPIIPYIEKETDKIQIYDICEKNLINYKTSLYCKNNTYTTEKEILKNQKEVFYLTLDKIEKLSPIYMYKDVSLYRITR